MKKLSLFVVAAVMSIVLVGCGTTKKEPETTEDMNTNTNMTTDNDAVTEDNNDDRGTGDVGDVNDNDDTVDHNGERRLDVADDVADKVSELDEVDRANVILTANEAYVAIETNTGEKDTEGTNTDTDSQISKELETKVANKVREAKSDVDQVYVSLDPDFVERMRDYRTRIDEGEPIEGFFDEFGEAMRDMFPNAR
ncbi:MAG TPA: YhcN/YlaJ family sporulation lipoprotein [Sporosarcina sp.]|nr:YhcN/YlaJ family sporulation lipoprotein [Sporosarcina sp.]